jgi:phosphoribosylanthranilate isomerase
MIVKICGITHPDDARAAAEEGASALGFNFYPKSVRYIEPGRAAAIPTPAGVWRAGIFVDAAPDEAERIAEEARLDIVQLYGGATPRLPRVWRAYRVTGPWSEPREDPDPEAILLDSVAPGSGSTFDWTLARGLSRPLVLAGGLDDTNVRAAIDAVEPWGVDACSRLESSPGRKDHHKLARFLKAALMR